MRAAPIEVGCSGWQYASWKNAFYPPDVPQSRWLAHYTRTFGTVEVNNTFYRLPAAAAFDAWRRATPDGFLFAVKASRFLTHLKRLRDPEPPILLLFDRLRWLGARLGPVLYQLPGTLARDMPRLRDFLAVLPRVIGGRGPIAWPEDVGAVPPLLVRHVIEFRHPSWYCDEVLSLLALKRIAVCLHDKTGSAFDADVAGPFVYVRFHGTTGHYAGSYPRAALERWAARMRTWSAAGLEVYAYFNNDMDAAAVGNARLLQSLVAR